MECLKSKHICLHDMYFKLLHSNVHVVCLKDSTRNGLQRED
jgi:hypothetical protein